VMRLLVEAGADIDAYDSQGNTPLLIAAEQRRTDVVMELIKLGADVNRKKRPRFATPLHAAVLRMDIGSVVALLSAGADVNAVVDGKYLVQTPDCRYCHSSSEQKEHLNRGCFTPFDILGFKCSTGLLDPYNDSLDYVRYSQAFRKASVSDERLHPNRNLTAFSAPESNGLQGGGWFQSLTSMNLILTQAGAKRRHEIKPSADLADEE
jgi:ankyrin repeat protein